MTRPDPPDRAPRPHRARPDRRVGYGSEGHQHARGDLDADPGGPGHRTGEHDPPRRRRPHQLPHRGRDVDPPVPGPVRPGPGVEAPDHRSRHRHPQPRHPRRVGRRRRRRDRTLRYGGRRSDRGGGGRNEGADAQQQCQDRPPPAATGPGRRIRRRRHDANSPCTRCAMALPALPPTLPGDTAGQTGFAENVDKNLRRSSRPWGTRAGGQRPPGSACGLLGPLRWPPASVVSGRPASWPGAGAPPWCASGRRGTR